MPLLLQEFCFAMPWDECGPKASRFRNHHRRQGREPAMAGGPGKRASWGPGGSFRVRSSQGV